MNKRLTGFYSKFLGSFCTGQKLQSYLEWESVVTSALLLCAKPEKKLVYESLFL